MSITGIPTQVGSLRWKADRCFTGPISMDKALEGIVNDNKLIDLVDKLELWTFDKPREMCEA